MEYSRRQGWGLVAIVLLASVVLPSCGDYSTRSAGLSREPPDASVDQATSTQIESCCVDLRRCEVSAPWIVTRPISGGDISVERPHLFPCNSGEGYRGCAGRFIESIKAASNGCSRFSLEWERVDNGTHVGYWRQRIHGVPVYGGGATVVRRGAGIINASLHLADDAFDPPGPFLSQENLLAMLQVDDSGEVLGPLRLMFLDRGLLGSPGDASQPVLCYQLQRFRHGIVTTEFRGAGDGGLLLEVSHRWEAPWFYSCGPGQGVEFPSPTTPAHDCNLLSPAQSGAAGAGYAGAFASLCETIHGLEGMGVVPSDWVATPGWAAGLRVFIGDEAAPWTGGAAGGDQPPGGTAGAFFLPAVDAIVMRSDLAPHSLLLHELAHAWLLRWAFGDRWLPWSEAGAIQEGAALVLSAAVRLRGAGADGPSLVELLPISSGLSYEALGETCEPAWERSAEGDGAAQACCHEWSTLAGTVFHELVEVLGLTRATMIYLRGVLFALEPEMGTFSSLASSMVHGCMDLVETGARSDDAFALEPVDCLLVVSVLGSFGFQVPQVEYRDSVELCDGLDNDGDGIVDEDAVDIGRVCGRWEEDLGQCRPGRRTLRPGQGGCLCKVGVGPLPEAGACDGLDDDCDGMTDEGLECCAANDVRPCGAPAQGACGSELEACDSVTGTWSGDCLREVDFEAWEPVEFTCDQVDNDCDGQTDEGIPGCCRPGESVPCGIDPSTCVTVERTCDDKGRWSECEIPPLPLTDGDCDGQDDDCDGQTDEDYPVAVGECWTWTDQVVGAECLGTWICVAGEEVCQPPSVLASELCNGLDDNCDGQTDEADALLFVASAEFGPVWVDAAGQEVCLVGEGCPGDSPPPSAGPCIIGIPACEEGNACCKQTVFPVAETCDGVDNDCDGLVDDLPGGCSLGFSLASVVLKGDADADLTLTKPLSAAGASFQRYFSLPLPRYFLADGDAPWSFRACLSDYCPAQGDLPPSWPESIEDWEAYSTGEISYSVTATQPSAQVLGLQTIVVGYDHPVFMNRYEGAATMVASCGAEGWRTLDMSPPSQVGLFDGFERIVLLGWGFLRGFGTAAGFRHSGAGCILSSNECLPQNCDPGGGCQDEGVLCDVSQDLYYNWFGDVAPYLSPSSVDPSTWLIHIAGDEGEAEGQWQYGTLWAPSSMLRITHTVLQCGHSGGPCAVKGTLLASMEGARRLVLVMLLRVHPGPAGASVITRVLGPSGGPLPVDEIDLADATPEALAGFVDGLVAEAAASASIGVIPDEADVFDPNPADNQAGEAYQVFLAVRPEGASGPPSAQNAHARALAVLIEY